MNTTKERKYKKHIGTTPGGASLDIHFTELSRGDSPHVYIQSGTHGGELTYWVVQDFLHFLRESDAWHGKVTLVGVANPAAWHQRTYFSTNGKFDLYDGKDWNRNFPGRKDGSLAERTAHILFSVAKKADFALDLHTSRNSPIFNITCDDEGLELAKKNGIPYTYHMPIADAATRAQYKGTFLLALLDAGVKNMTLECGAHDSFDKENIEAVLAAVKRMCTAEGLLSVKGNAVSAEKTHVYNSYSTYHAPDGGYVRYRVTPGQRYTKGDLLYQVCQPNDFSIIDVHANEDGIAMKLAPTYIMHPGDQVLQCIPAEGMKCD